MIKFIVIAALLIGAIIYTPYLYQQYALWDVSDPSDDESFINSILLSATPVSTPSEVKQSIDLRAGAIIIDIRTQLDYDEGHIPDAILIPEQDLYTQIPKKYPDKSRTIYLYDKNGRNAAVATRLLRSMGYEKSFGIQNGLTGWKDFGNPVDSLYYFAE